MRYDGMTAWWYGDMVHCGMVIWWGGMQVWGQGGSDGMAA